MTEITDERRREVAARLREEDARTVPLVCCGLALADLVDRPTCTNEAEAPQDFVCGRCGAEYYDVYSVRYCPACGAEVVDA